MTYGWLLGRLAVAVVICTPAFLACSSEISPPPPPSPGVGSQPASGVDDKTGGAAEEKRSDAEKPAAEGKAADAGDAGEPGAKGKQKKGEEDEAADEGEGGEEGKKAKGKD